MPATPATRLSALDAAFLQVDEAAAPAHVGGVLLLDGQAPAYDDVAALLAARLEALPRWRSRLAYPPGGGLLRPCWVEDPTFDLRLHLRHAGLPRPRTEAQLQELAGRILSERLDHRKPLWELHLVDGVEGGRFAVVTKLHPTLVGTAGAGVVAALLDSAPVDADRGARLLQEGRPVAPPPSEAQVLATSALGQAREVAGTLRGALQALRRDPAAAALAVARSAREATDRIEARLDGAPPSPYNGPTGAPRRLAWARADVPAVRRAAAQAGMGEDELVLAAVVGALRTHLRRRGHDAAALRALVRTSDGREGPAELPVGEHDRAARLTAVRDAARRLPRAAAVHPRTVNLAIATFPGPDRALHLLGRPLREVFPVLPLAPDHALSVAVIRCGERVGVGLLGCAGAMADLDDLARDVDRELADLTHAGNGMTLRRVRRRTARDRDAPGRGVLNSAFR